MTSAAPRVAVIVVTYESSEHLDRCFGSLARARGVGSGFCVIAVDNASRDDTVERLRRDHGWVTVVANDRNVGFAAGCNAGIQVARERSCEFVYLLNPDTEVEPTFLDAALAVADANPSVGAVQSLLLLDGERDVVNSSGNEIHFLGFGHCGGFRSPVSSVPAEPRSIPFASGASVLYRTSALTSVGSFDETLFLYQEDMDVGIRLRLAGWDVLLAPASRVYHDYRERRGSEKYYWLERNRVLVLAKNLRGRTLAVLAPALVLADVAVLAMAVRQGWARRKLRATSHLLTRGAWRHIRAERRHVRAIRRISDRELVEAFTPRIVFDGVTDRFVERVANPVMAAVWPALKRLVR